MLLNGSRKEIFVPPWDTPTTINLVLLFFCRYCHDVSLCRQSHDVRLSLSIMSGRQDMKHSSQDFSQVMKSAIELASFFQDADTEQRNVIKGYFKTCIPDLVSNDPGIELEQGSKNQRQKAGDALAGKVTNEDDFFIAASDIPNRVAKKKTKRHLIATRKLEQCGNNKELAARELNISLRTFYRWLED